MNELLELADRLGPRLAWTSLHAAALVCLIMAALKLRPHWPAAVRSLLWWMVGLQVLAGLALPSPVALPLLQPVTTASSEITIAPVVSSLAPATTIQLQPTAPAGLGWVAGLCGVWAIVAFWRCLRLAMQWRQNHQRVRQAVDAGGAARRLCDQLADRLKLRRSPRLRQSTAIRSPQVSGWLRPVILLPADHGWSNAELQLVLGHELAHVRRGDLWLGWVMAVAEHLLWFHPLVGWAARQYALNRELACDQLALRTADSAEPALYGRLLLQVSVQPTAGGRLMGASDSFLTLRRRLLALQQRQESRWGPAAMAVLLLALLGSLPYQLTAASPAPMPPSLPAPPPPPDLPPLPATPATPAQRSAPSAQAWPSPPGAHIRGPAYALIVPTPHGYDEESTVRPAEMRSLQSLARQTGRALWWSQQGGVGYLITDTQNLDTLRRIYAPVSQYWTDSGRLSGRYWGLRGQLEGLSGWQDSVVAQQRTLAGTDGPARTAQLRDLQRQLAEIHNRSQILWRQLDGMRGEIAANQQQGVQLMRQANSDAQRLLSQAIADGRARHYDLIP
ncbi:M56 family metallopeptidase [Frateuria aurantia]